MFSWEVAYQGGSGCGIAATQSRAMRAVAEMLGSHGGHGIVQACSLGPYAGDGIRSQYAYGNVICRATAVSGTVNWTLP